ncbi:MAG: restriction endonuclease subunit S [bacterium]
MYNVDMEQFIKDILIDDFWIMPATPEYLDEGVPYITSKNIKNGVIDFTKVNYISQEAYENISKNRPILVGDILISMIGTLGETAEVKEWDGNFYGQNMFLVRLDENVVNKRYFLNFFKSNCFKRALEGKQNQSTQKYLKANHIEDLIIPVPSLEEQKLIGERLDKLSNVILLRQEELQLLDNLIKARFIEMFGDPISNSYGLPETTLSELGEFGRGVSKHRPRNDPKLLGGEYPLIQTGDVAATSLYITSYNSTYSELGLKQSKMWSKGTLCITIAANIAKTAILDFDACFPDSVVGFTANEKTNNVFIHYWFSFFQAILESQAPESAQKNINLKILSELKVIVPEKAKQDEFVEFIKQVNKSKAVVQKALDESQLLFDSLMQEYFG